MFLPLSISYILNRSYIFIIFTLCSHLLMSSNNLDEKQLLQYITRCFQNWGLSYASQDVLKRSKKNEDQAIQPMTRLLFNLCLLHIFDYKYSPEHLAITFPKEQEMLEIILAHLFEVDCPLVVARVEKGRTQVGFDFTSSKYLLIACGWVMGVSNFFGQTQQKLFKGKFDNIYKPKPLNFASLRQKYSNVLKETNLHQNSDKLSRISYLAKILKMRKYSVGCLMDKKNKILNRLKDELKSIDASLNIEDIISSGNPEETQSLEAELKDMLVFQKQNMGFRKYWWIWLEQKIIASQYTQLPNHFEDFERKEVAPESVKYNISIDLNFVGKYVQLIDVAENKLQSIQRKIEQLQIKGDKAYKQIQRDIQQEIKSTIQQRRGREDETPSFIGMQLQKYMKLQQKNTQAPKQSKKALEKASEKSFKKMQGSIKKFVSQIDAIVLI